MFMLDVLKLKYLATTRSGPAMTERDIVSQNTLTPIPYSVRLRN